MKKFEKSPPWLKDLFDSLLAETIGERRQMFGYPAGFLNGNMFGGLFGSSMLVRLGEADRAALLKLEGAETFDPMGGRPMREYVVVPPDMLEDEEALRRWLARAIAFAETLPPKSAKKKPAAKDKPAVKKKPVSAGASRAPRSRATRRSS